MAPKPKLRWYIKRMPNKNATYTIVYRMYTVQCTKCLITKYTLCTKCILCKKKMHTSFYLYCQIYTVYTEL